MIKLSVNVNKIATLRNSRGGNHPDILDLSQKILDYGAHGITIHPREDERHIRTDDIKPLRDLVTHYNQQTSVSREFNIEGEPSERFLQIILDHKPDQATLVPVKPGEITSDHGFQFPQDSERLQPIVAAIKKAGIRVSIFVEAGVQNLQIAKDLGVDRIEFYTGPFAERFDRNPNDGKAMFTRFDYSAREAISKGLEINAGHDLDHKNLELFRALPGLKEVSIGHRLISQALEWGLEKTIKTYLEVLNGK
ncbi:pyridoxine 5'-phosphate synthase [Leptospira sp. GIMC2001]|uniref:pyridoxine 5'-phosphate synthase n=1 Tax=Leptospira sp. GIMC2001 TaxID=1513297 RepID=UPI00234959FF|nr:pyridoxine 5'-phosphate synthase [Leptospira sp. GIMC2001]WCL48993.1 pyridoxine 5'-phosphate synthase [Leptospira sp. GIMC2001]